MSDQVRMSAVTMNCDGEEIEIRVNDSRGVILKDVSQDESVHMEAEMWPLVLAKVKTLLECWDNAQEQER